MTKPSITITDFLKPPTPGQWRGFLKTGWTGPDGSSSSLDDIQGIRIGITSPSFEHANLPANKHDYFYELGRRLSLPASYRKAADIAYRDGCKAFTVHLIGLSGKLAIFQSNYRYLVLRLLGWRAWRKR